MNKLFSKFRGYWGLLGGVALAVAFMFIASGHAFAANLYSYVVPTTLVPADVSSDNMIAVATQFITNPAVLTLILLGLAVGLIRSIVRALRAVKRA